MLNVLKTVIKDIRKDRNIQFALIVGLAISIVAILLGIILGLLFKSWLVPDIPEGTIFCNIDQGCIKQVLNP